MPRPEPIRTAEARRMSGLGRALLMAAAICLPTAPQADEAHADIVAVVQKYLDGTASGRPELVAEAFLPSLEVQWLGEDDRLMRRTGPAYIARIDPGVAVPRRGRIVAIDATERSAMVKAEIEWNDRIYTDYMLLLRVEGEWRIANKIATWTAR